MEIEILMGKTTKGNAENRQKNEEAEKKGGNGGV